MTSSEWQPMETSPRDGSKFDVLCKSEAGVEIAVAEIHWGYKPMDAKGKGDMILWGKHNFLSPYLTAIGWKPRIPKTTIEDEVEKEKPPYDKLKTPRPL